MSRNILDRARDAIRAAYPLPLSLERLRYLATYDLWHGPMPVGFLDDGDDGEPWPGFAAACERLREWASDTLPGTLWYDADCDSLSESEPESWLNEETGEWEEPFLEETYRLEWSDILAAVFPRQLSEYV